MCALAVCLSAGLTCARVCLCVTLSQDFGGGHPDPNLVYAHDLVHIMGTHCATRTACASTLHLCWLLLSASQA